MEKKNITIELPEPLIKWLIKVAHMNHRTLQDEIINTLLGDLRSILETDFCNYYVYEAAIKDGLHKVFQEYNQTPTHTLFKKLVQKAEKGDPEMDQDSRETRK